MPRPYRVELMPGVFLTGLQTKKFKSCYLALRLLAPLREETAAMNAVLPRVLRQGTRRYPTQEKFAAALEDLYGGLITPVVSRKGETQCFGFAGTFLDDALVPDGTPLLDEAARMMGDLWMNPAAVRGRLNSEYVAREKENLTDEIKSSRNDKRQYANQRLIELMCKGEGFAVGRLGNLRSVKKVGIVRLQNHYWELLSTAPIELYYCGSASQQRVENAWQQALMGLNRGKTAEYPLTDWKKEPPEQPKNLVEHEAVIQGKLVMGFRTGISSTSRRYPALMLANAMFGGSANARLFRIVREELSLCYYANSVLEAFKGLMIVQSGVAFQDFEQAKTEILHQLTLLQQGAFSDEELESARKFLVRSLCTMMDEQQRQSDYWLNQTIAEQMVTPEERIAQLEEVTRQQVIEAAAQIRLDSIYELHGEETAGEEA